MLIAAISLFLNGLGVYLTIHASIGVGPWDVLNIGVSKTLGILYGNASINVAFIILFIDVLLREPIGIAMIIDAIVVGKSVDFFNWIDVVPVPHTLAGSIVMMIIGLFIMGYTQYGYMWASLGCGPRDTLLVGLKRHAGRFPIGGVSIILLCAVTLIGYLLGGPVGIGTLICAFCAGPIMQFAFSTVGFVATDVKHQNILETVRIFCGRKTEH
ncbi:MAG: hypothetical protein IJT40_04415 [Firmicutes bacterium]|nr:hypothetical protein [Bacillota bacterium]